MQFWLLVAFGYRMVHCLCRGCLFLLVCGCCDSWWLQPVGQQNKKETTTYQAMDQQYLNRGEFVLTQITDIEPSSFFVLLLGRSKLQTVLA